MEQLAAANPVPGSDTSAETQGCPSDHGNVGTHQIVRTRKSQARSPPLCLTGTVLYSTTDLRTEYAVAIQQNYTKEKSVICLCSLIKFLEKEYE